MVKYNKIYEHYITPVLSNLDNFALNELYNDNLARDFLNQIRSPRFRFKRRAIRETIIQQLYWCVLQLYSNTRLMNHNATNTLDNICATVDAKTGKCNLPARYRSILKIHRGPKGYYGTLNMQNDGGLTIDVIHGQENIARALIEELSDLPLLSVDEMLVGFQKLGKIAKLAASHESNAHKLLQEYRTDTGRTGRILDVQNKINEIRKNSTEKIKILEQTIPYSMLDDTPPFNDPCRATQTMCVMSVLMTKSQATEELKTLSGVPLRELEYTRMRRGCK